MAKGKKNPTGNPKNVPEQASEEATSDTKPDVTGAVVAHDESHTPDVTPEIEATPFVFESISPPAELSEQSESQFSGDEMEFESWMFDAGEGRGIVMPETMASASPSAQFQAPGTSVAGEAQDEAMGNNPPIIGRDMPTPDFVNAFVQDQNVPESPIDMMYGSVHDSSLNIENLLAGMTAPPVQSPRPYEYYPETISGWSDQLLASVDDFSSVLLAIQGGPAVEAPVESRENISTEPAVSESYADAAGYEANAFNPIEAAEPTDTVQPPWQLGDLQPPVFTGPDELTHDPSAYSAESHPGGEAEPYQPEQFSPQAADAMWAVPDVEAPQADQSMEPVAEIAGPDFSWLDEAPTEQYQAQPESAEALAWPQDQPQDQMVEASAGQATEEGDVEVGQPATQVPAPAWSPVMDENLPPWLVEAAETGMDAVPTEAQAAQYPPTLEQPDEAGVQWAQTEQYNEAVPFQADPFAENPAPGSAVEQQTASAGAREEQPEGQFKGEDMEFESWMFDPGQAAPLPMLPGMGQFMPAVQDMEAEMVSPAHAGASAVDIEAQIARESMAEATQEASSLELDSVHPADESLPFWLEDRPDIERHPGGLPAPEAADFSPLASAVQAPSMQSVATDQPALSDAQDIAELPPIEPFDFSLLQPVQEEEKLGFSTEELASLQPQDHERLVVTANLDVLADLLGKDKSAASYGGMEVADAEIDAVNALLMPTVKSPQDVQPEPQPEQSVPEPPAQEAPPVPAPPAQEIPAENRSWTAMETSQLSVEKPGDLITGVTAMPADARATVSMANPVEISEEELDVSPFDIDELDLAAEESNTEYLTSSLLRTAQDSPQKILTGTLFGSSEDGSPDFWEAPAWMADVVQSENDGLDRNTSRFSMQQATEEPEATESTQYLPAASGRKAADAPVVAQPSGEFRARVSRFSIVGSPLQDEPEQDMPSPTVAAQEDFQSYDDDYPEEGRSSRSSAPPTPSMTSGSLPRLQGFEDLEQMVAARPGEVGPLMALAVAYAQAGELEHAVHEYHRLLQNRKVPAPMLEIISDQLDDIENEASGLARYHQVRGDLYMKQGMHEQAVEEYNKIK